MLRSLLKLATHIVRIPASPSHVYIPSMKHVHSSLYIHTSTHPHSTHPHTIHTLTSTHPHSIPSHLHTLTLHPHTIHTHIYTPSLYTSSHFTHPHIYTPSHPHTLNPHTQLLSSSASWLQWRNNTHNSWTTLSRTLGEEQMKHWGENREWLEWRSEWVWWRSVCEMNHVQECGPPFL